MHKIESFVSRKELAAYLKLILQDKHGFKSRDTALKTHVTNMNVRFSYLACKLLDYINFYLLNRSNKSCVTLVTHFLTSKTFYVCIRPKSDVLPTSRRFFIL